MPSVSQEAPTFRFLGKTAMERQVTRASANYTPMPFTGQAEEKKQKEEDDSEEEDWRRFWSRL